MDFYPTPRHRLHPADRYLLGRLVLPADPASCRDGTDPERPRLSIEVRCDECDKVCKYPFPDHGDPRMTKNYDLMVPIEAPACKCQPHYVGLDENHRDHAWKLDEFKRLVRAWDHQRAIRSPEIRAIMHQNQRLRLDMLGYEF